MSTADLVPDFFVDAYRKRRVITPRVREAVLAAMGSGRTRSRRTRAVSSSCRRGPHCRSRAKSCSKIGRGSGGSVLFRWRRRSAITASRATMEAMPSSSPGRVGASCRRACASGAGPSSCRPPALGAPGASAISATCASSPRGRAGSAPGSLPSARSELQARRPSPSRVPTSRARDGLAARSPCGPRSSPARSSSTSSPRPVGRSMGLASSTVAGRSR